MGHKVVGTQVPVRQILRQCGCQPAVLDAARAFAVVEPVAAMVMRGRWRDLVWQARWKPSPPIVLKHPDSDWAEGRAGQQEAQFDTEITYNNVTSLMQNLRRWLPSIGAGAVDPAGEQMLLELDLQWLACLLATTFDTIF